MSAVRSKVVVISGGSRGLGLALVRRCLEDGWAVATCSRSTSPGLSELHTRFGPERLLWSALDVTATPALEDFVQEVLVELGDVDALINNSGIGLDGIFPMARSTDIDRILDVNLRATLALTRLCSRSMLARGGAILSISSVNAIRGHAGVAAYSATKAALDGFTRSLARELGPKGIRVNSLAPGYFDSDMVRDLSGAARNRILRRTPLGRLASPDDIADVALFLLSEGAGFITGQTLVVDGGITC